MSEKYDGGASKNVYKIIIGEELWLCAYEPKTKQKSTVWVFEPEPKPTEVVCRKITSKQMVAYFFCKAGHLATVPHQYRKAVNSEWYTTICLPKSSKLFAKLRR